MFQRKPVYLVIGIEDFMYNIQNHKYSYHKFITYKMPITNTFCRPTSMQGMNEICTVKPTDNVSVA